MHQSCTSHDSPPAPSDKSVSCSFVLLPVQMFTAFFLLFFFCLSCYIPYVCLAPTSYICLSPILHSPLLHFFCLSCSLSLNLSCSIAFFHSSSIIFLSLLLYIFCLSCSISSVYIASFLFVSHSRLTRLNFLFSPPLSKSVLIFSKFLSVSFTFNLSQSLPISFSVCLTRFLSISQSLTPSVSRSIYLSVFLVTCLSVYRPVSSNFRSIKLQFESFSHSPRLQFYFLSLAFGCELIASFTIVSESSQMNCFVLHVE
jgi:hypothetical protein